MSSNYFNVHIHSKMLVWDSQAVEKKLTNLTSVDRKTTWIREDLSTAKSSILGRALWIFVRHISLFRKAFYKIDLKQSEKVLQELKPQIESQHVSMIPLFNQSIDRFNAQFPKHQLDKVPEANPSTIQDKATPKNKPSTLIVPQMEIPLQLTVSSKPEIPQKLTATQPEIPPELTATQPEIPPKLMATQPEKLSQENQDWIRENFLAGRSGSSQPGGIPVLTNDQIATLKDKLENGPFPFPLTKRALNTLKNPKFENTLNKLKTTKPKDALDPLPPINLTWLSDSVIDEFLKAYKNPQVDVFLTLFYIILSGGIRKEELSNWKPVQTMFAKDRIIVPINEKGLFWTLAVIDIKEKRIEYYDSHENRNGDPHILILNRLHNWVVDQAKLQGKDADGWTTHQVPVPFQDNSDDCGVFLCRFAERIAEGRYLPNGSYDFDFQAENAPYYRLYMAHRLLNQNSDI